MSVTGSLIPHDIIVNSNSAETKGEWPMPRASACGPIFSNNDDGIDIDHLHDALRDGVHSGSRQLTGAQSRHVRTICNQSSIGNNDFRTDLNRSYWCPYDNDDRRAINVGDLKFHIVAVKHTILPTENTGCLRRP